MAYKCLCNAPGGEVSKILAVDDDEKLLESVQEFLSRSGYIVDPAFSAEEAEEMLRGFDYDLLVLDWQMPGMSGLELLAKLRTQGFKAPVLMLTGQNLVENKLEGLDAGADDYLTKPFDGRELVARVRALLRRPEIVSSKELKLSNVCLDQTTQHVTWHGIALNLTKQEYQLLELLMRHKNEIFSHEALVERAWSSLSEASSDTVRVHMSRLRKKFESASTASECPIRTLHGKGYVFAAERSNSN